MNRTQQEVRRSLQLMHQKQANLTRELNLVNFQIQLDLKQLKQFSSK